MKRFFAVFAVILVLVSCVCIPSSAYFAAGVDADGYTLVEVPYRPLNALDDGGNPIRYLTYNDFMNAGVLYEYQGSSAYGCALYSYGAEPRLYPVYGAMVKGSVLNENYSGFDNDMYYTVAVSRGDGWIGSIVKSGSSFYNYNGYTVNAPSTTGRLSFNYPRDASGSDILFYYGIMSNQRYSREIITQHEEFECSSSLFDSWNKLMSALDRAENGGSSSDTSLSLTTTIPAGNALVIGFTNDLDVSCTAKFNTFYRRGTRSTTMQYFSSPYKLDDLHLTTSSTSTGSHSIPFQTAPPYTSSDTSYYVKWDYSYHAHTGTQYLYIVNPLYNQSYMATSSGSVAVNEINPSLSVTFSGRSVSYDLYVLSASTASNSGQVSSTSVGSSENSVSGSADSSGVISWTDSNGKPYVPKTGGLNDVSESGDDGLFPELSGWFDTLVGIFTWGHNAAQSIISGSRDFFAAFTSIFSWMPPEVLSVLSACLILILVIGVVKVLL